LVNGLIETLHLRQGILPNGPKKRKALLPGGKRALKGFYA
jgi:hypothetical protein